MDVLALAPQTLVCARGTLDRSGGRLTLTLTERLGAGLRQLPALVQLNHPCGVVILGGDGIVPSRNGGMFHLTAPMMVVHSADSLTPPPVRLVEPDFSACFTSTAVVGEHFLELSQPVADEVAATILATPSEVVELASASHAADAHLRAMTVYQAECYGIRRRGLVISYVPPTDATDGVEPTTSLWLNGSGESNPVLEGITQKTY